MSTTAVHVYQPGNLPPYHENTPQAQYLVYGQHHPQILFRDIFIHDAPVGDEQKAWLKVNIESRLQKGGVVRYLPSPSPVSTVKDSVR